jgi:hypothetical protein
VNIGTGYPSRLEAAIMSEAEKKVVDDGQEKAEEKVRHCMQSIEKRMNTIVFHRPYAY